MSLVRSDGSRAVFRRADISKRVSPFSDFPIGKSTNRSHSNMRLHALAMSCASADHRRDT